MILEYASNGIQFTVGLFLTWVAWNLRSIAAYFWAVVIMALCLMVSGGWGIVTIASDLPLNAINHWRRPLFITERAATAFFALTVVFRNKLLSSAAREERDLVDVP